MKHQDVAVASSRSVIVARGLNEFYDATHDNEASRRRCRKLTIGDCGSWFDFEPSTSKYEPAYQSALFACLPIT